MVLLVASFLMRGNRPLSMSVAETGSTEPPNQPLPQTGGV
jgi:hypothetical protein